MPADVSGIRFSILQSDRAARQVGERWSHVLSCNDEQRECRGKSFFTGYEAANAVFDVEEIAACYAEVFMFGGPAGVQCVKKEDFLKFFPGVKSFLGARIGVLEHWLPHGVCGGLKVHAGNSGLEYAF